MDARDRAATTPTGPPTYIGPRPGTGTVFVNHCHDHWYGVWQGEDPLAMENTEGTRDQVLARAHSRPAAEHLIFSPAAGDHVPLPR